MAEPAVLVCGLGSLGQACLRRLLSFQVPLHCLDLAEPSWLDPQLETRLSAHLTLGDMRLPHVLRQAGGASARAVLLLSSDSTVNIEAALQVRLLNPRAEIVVRSSSNQADLGSLLEERLQGIAVVDPVLLCAEAVASALRPESIPASFEAHGEHFQLVEQTWHDSRLQRRLRSCGQEQWTSPLYVTPRSLPQHEPDHDRSHPRRQLGGKIRRWSQRLPRPARLNRRRQVMLIGLVALTVLGIRLFSELGGWRQGLFVTLALLKGEYVDPVNVLLAGDAGLAGASGWLIGGTLFYSLVGTLLTSALVAVILERLLRDRLGGGRSRLPRRHGRPILLVEGGTLAQRVASLLQREGRTVLVAGVHARGPGLPFEDLPAALGALGNRAVRAIGLLSSDLLANLQLALSLQQRWPEARIAMLAHAFGAADQLGQLLGGVAVISTMDLVADAVVATAFGERIEAVLRLRGTTLLQVRYRINQRDTLCGQSIARLESGYAITVVSLLRAGLDHPLALPRLETVVAEGDQLMVLATADSLRRIELGDATPPDRRVQLRIAANAHASRRFEAQRSLARWLGCAPGEVAELLDGREHVTPPIDTELAELLIDDLQRQGVQCRLEEYPGEDC